MRDDAAEFIVDLPALQAVYCCKSGARVTSGRVWLSPVNVATVARIYGPDAIKAVAAEPAKSPAESKAKPSRAKPRKSRASKAAAKTADPVGGEG